MSLPENDSPRPRRRRPPETPDGYITKQECARRLGYGVRTIERRIASREIACTRDAGMLFIPATEVDRLRAEKTVPVGPRRKRA